MALDFTKICRICLEANKATYDIYTSYYVKKSTLYSDMLINCTRLKPEIGDGLPRLLCKECSRQLKRTYAFNLQCDESDKRLKFLLENPSKVDAEINGCSDAFVKDELNFEDLKFENSREANEELLLTTLDDSNQEDIKDIKLEPLLNDNGNDSCWDADDDVLLEEIKIKKTENENTEEKPKKKRGRKKKENPPKVDTKINGCSDAFLKDELNSEDLKFENSREANEELLLTTLDDSNQEEIKDIKPEPLLNDDGNDSCWDANDDVLLEEIKIKKTENENTKEKPKKKRGRKKKVYLEGESRRLPESKLPHQCDICGKFLSTKSNLKAHKLCHTDLRPFLCPECPATFRGHSALFQHKKVHTGETPYHCTYCPKKFGRRTGLVNHIRMHEGEKLYSCDICFKTFVQSAQLSIHMKRHKGDKPYLCQVCGKGFPIKAELKIHQRTHNGEKPYSCHLCTKTFATSGNLSIHVRIHNKEVRYNCKECQRGFITCSAYNVHLKRHKGQRDYHCECGKTFYTSSALKQHRVVHTGEKKYQCKICDRKFTQTSHLSRHFKRDHAKPNAPVPSSDHYKVVLPENKNVFNLFDNTMQKIAQNGNGNVKCEGT